MSWNVLSFYQVWHLCQIFIVSNCTFYTGCTGHNQRAQTVQRCTVFNFCITRFPVNLHLNFSRCSCGVNFHSKKLSTPNGYALFSHTWALINTVFTQKQDDCNYMCNITDTLHPHLQKCHLQANFYHHRDHGRLKLPVPGTVHMVRPQHTVHRLFQCK